jgi:nucleoside-triphosphatase
MKKNILLQGYPGVGKTTVIKKTIHGIESAGGFYTEEIREGSRRRGFKITTLEGKQGTLAYKGRASPHRVGTYGVDIAILESLGVESIRETLDDKSKWLVVIDEIGAMELFSSHFRDAVIEAFNSPKKVLATIPIKSNVFVEKLKSHKGTALISVSVDNRDSVPDKISRIIMGA